MPARTPIAVRDLVRYTAAFCRSTGQYTPPIDGVVCDVGTFVAVQWCDRAAPVLVHPGNLERIGPCPSWLTVTPGGVA